jgi:chaperonin GroES
MELEKTLSIDKILESSNLAEKLYEADLEKIGLEVHEGYTTDLLSRASWEGKIEEWTKLALQVTESKTFPWVGAANVKYPLITTAALQFSARAYPALLPGTSPVRGRVIGYDQDGSKTERAIRVGKHMSYQILEQMDDWEEEMDRLLFSLPIMGCVFKKTYFDSVKGINASEVVYPKELVVNYWAKNLEEAERVTHILKMSDNDIYERVQGGIYIEQDLETANPETLRKTQTVTDAVSGMQQPQEDDTTPHLILEQCTYIDLDGDGYKEPYIVTIDEASAKVLRIVPRFTIDEIEYTDKDKILRITPKQYYTKFSFIPSPDGGFYDIGFGVLLGPINETINTLINQLLDSGTLNNLQSGFLSKGIRIKGGQKSFTPGEWKTVNSIGDDLRKGLVPLPTKEPSQVLFSLLGMMVEAGEKLSSVTEVMTGDIPGQNTKATVAMAAIEQGMKVFSSIYKRIHRSLSKEYKKLFKLNAIFLPEEDYFNILDVGQEGAEQIKQQDYAEGDIDVIPTSDPNIATQEQKISKIQAVGELLQMGTVNPQEYTKRMLEATEQPNIEALMEMPEAQPNEEFEFEKEKFREENERAWEELDIKRTIAEASATKNYADAEAAEPGQQLEQYMGVMKMNQEDDLASMKLDQSMQTHQEKMQEMQEQQQQKMQQQQQQGDQKLRQQEQQHQQKMQQAAQMPQGGTNGTSGNQQ